MKTIYIQYKDEFPPRTHDLVKIVDSLGLDVDEQTIEFLDAVNTFNISARYPDEKLKFYKLCTKSFTEEHFEYIKEIHYWLLKKIYH